MFCDLQVQRVSGPKESDVVLLTPSTTANRFFLVPENSHFAVVQGTKYEVLNDLKNKQWISEYIMYIYIYL